MSIHSDNERHSRSAVPQLIEKVIFILIFQICDLLTPYPLAPFPLGKGEKFGG